MDELIRKRLADEIRNNPLAPYSTLTMGINPFFAAEAIYIDGGATLGAGEIDAGIFFILAGESKGEFIPYWEVVGLAGSSADLGAEIGRIDYTGDSDNFETDMLFDERLKFYGGFGAVWSLGGSFAIGPVPGTRDFIIERSMSISFGISIIEPLTLGVNGGKKYPFNHP